MYIRPELQALRGDDTPQRQAQAALHLAYQGWRSAGAGHLLEAELIRFGDGAALEDLPLLAALFDQAEDGTLSVIGDLVTLIMARLEAEPLSQSPLRFSTDEAHASVVLARCGDTTLVLQAFNGASLARRSQPASLAFPPTETFERVLAGSADTISVTALALRPDAAELEFTDCAIETGQVAHRIGQSEARLLRHVPGVLVVLKLQRRLAAGEPTREYRLSDGAMIHQAAGSSRDSRLELAVALLGRMGRSDAAPLLAAMAEEDGSQSLRWQALRECLGLDTVAGFSVLCRIAQRADDPLAVPAGALRAQLLETYPQLAGVNPCPA